MGSSHTLPLLRASEDLLSLAVSHHLTLSAVHLPGWHRVWADALPWTEVSSMELSLHSDTISDLVELYGLMDLDLFAAVENHHLPLYLTTRVQTEEGGPDDLLTAWDRWSFIYLFIYVSSPSCSCDVGGVQEAA